MIYNDYFWLFFDVSQFFPSLKKKGKKKTIYYHFYFFKTYVT